MLKNLWTQFIKKTVYGVVGSYVPILVPMVAGLITGKAAEVSAHVSPALQALIGGVSTGLVAAIYRAFKYDPQKAGKP